MFYMYHDARDFISPVKSIKKYSSLSLHSVANHFTTNSTSCWPKQYTKGVCNNVAASLAASLDSSSSTERFSRKARLAKMAPVAKVF